MKKVLITLLVSLTTIISISFANTITSTTTNINNIPIQVDPQNSQVIALISEDSGYSIPVLGTTELYYQINYNETIGYISKAYTVEGAKELTENSLKFHMEKCKAFYRDNGFTYGYYGNIPANTSNRQTDCSTYVSWALYEYAKANNIPSLETRVKNKLRSYKFNNIGKNLSKGETDEHFMLVNPNDAKLGDILCYDGHVEFYAGSLTESGYSYVYNCGSTSAIRSKTLVTKAANRKLSQTTYILRLRSDLKSGLAPSIQL